MAGEYSSTVWSTYEYTNNSNYNINDNYYYMSILVSFMRVLSVKEWVKTILEIAIELDMGKGEQWTKFRHKQVEKKITLEYR